MDTLSHSHPPPNSSLDPTLSSAPKIRQACIGCRGIKARCQLTDELEVPCARCKRLRLPCEFKRQKRGRKSNAERERIKAQRSRSASPPRRPESVPQASASSSSTGSLVPRSGGVSSSGRGHAYGPELHGAGHGLGGSGSGRPGALPSIFSFVAGGSTPSFLTITSPSAPTRGSGEDQTSPTVDVSPLGGTPGATQPRTQYRVDVSEYLDPGEAAEGRPGEAPTIDLGVGGRRSMEDPLALGLVSVAQARTLVDLFHAHLNPPLALLDPNYHTLSYMHETSYALLTGVLAASSKFFHTPEVYRSLLDHAQILINRAVAEGSCEIGMIQCLMILSHFKATRDRTAWIKIGMALRFAFQINLHKVVQLDNGLPSEEEAARTQLNLERTWFCLCCFDSTFSNLFLLPLTIQAHQRGDADRWSQNHLDLGPPCDLRLACSVEFLEMGAQVHALKVNPTTKEYRSVILPQLLHEIDRHNAKWFTGRLSRLAEHEETALKIGQFSQGLTVRMMLIDDGVDPHSHLAEGLVIGGRVVEWVELIAAHGNLLYCQDTTSVHLARLVVFFHNYFRRFMPAQQALAVDLMKRLNAACLGVPNMSADGAPAFVARLIQRVLRSLTTRSVVPSRTTSPGLHEGERERAAMVGPQVSEAVMTDLDEFLATITVPDLSTVDDQTWANLFGDTLLDQFPFINDA